MLRVNGVVWWLTRDGGLLWIPASAGMMGGLIVHFCTNDGLGLAERAIRESPLREVGRGVFVGMTGGDECGFQFAMGWAIIQRLVAV